MSNWITPTYDQQFIRDRSTIQPSGCWTWNLRIDNDGYGRYTTHMAYRISHEVFNGPIPDGYHVDHLCRVRACVNPEHLEAVTRAENQARMVASGVLSRKKYKPRIEATHCKHGHEFTPENSRLFTRPGSSRVSRACRACARASAERIRVRKAAESLATSPSAAR